MPHADATLMWIDKIYIETLTLLEEAQNYHAHKFKKQIKHLVPVQRLEVTKECLRVTSRLSHAMAWLMSEKAILNDELDRSCVEEQYRPLLEEDICTKPTHNNIDDCPSGLISLMERSFKLFMRVSRLEKMLRS